MINYWWVTRPKRRLDSIPEVLATFADISLNQASKVTMMTDYDNGICESCIDEYIDEFIAGQQTDVQCEDAVSKETILKFLDGWMSALDENCHNQSVSDLKIIKRDFENLPPVTPKQRTGYWIPVGMVEAVGGESAQWGSAIAYHRCSECDEQALRDDFWQEVLSKWCPHCGAKMEGGAE